MGLFDLFRSSKSGPAIHPGWHKAADYDPAVPFFDAKGVPNMVHQQIADAKSGRLPWVSTLTPAELSLAQSHGFKMIGTIVATCWMHYGFSWTEGHAQGWQSAQKRLQAEAAALGANAVIDVKMITVKMESKDSMDYSLVGTAVRIEGLKPSPAPVLSTVPALEFIELMEAGIIPVGLAIGARFAWSNDNLDSYVEGRWYGNQALTRTTAFWESIRRAAHADLRKDTARQGNGVLAEINFGELFKQEAEEEFNVRYLGRHIVMGTVVDCKKGATVPQKIQLVLDMSDKPDAMRTTSKHHNAFEDGI